MEDFKNIGIQWPWREEKGRFTKSLTEHQKQWLKNRSVAIGEGREVNHIRENQVIDRLINKALGEKFLIDEPEVFADFWGIQDIHSIPAYFRDWISITYLDTTYIGTRDRFILKIGSLTDISNFVRGTEEEWIKEKNPAITTYCFKKRFQPEQALVEFEKYLNEQLEKWTHTMEQNQEKIYQFRDKILDLAMKEIVQIEEKRNKNKLKHKKDL